MSNGGSADGPGPVERLLGLLLRTFPRSFVETHGRDLLEMCRDSRRDRGRRGWLTVPFIIIDILTSGLSARLELRRERRRQGDGWVGGTIFMANLATDFRQGLKSLLKAPGFTAVALVTVALGIGANAAIFTVVHNVLLKPLPYERSEELVSVRSRFLPESGFDFRFFSLDPVEYLDYRDTNRSFSQFAAFYGSGVTYTGEEVGAERIQAIVATWNMLPLLEVKPLLGRLFVQEDDLPDASFKVVLTHGFWQRSFGADPAVVGQSLTLNGRAAEVIGVLPEGFFYPRPNVALFTTLNLSENPSGRQSHYLQGLARLAPGVTYERAQADMDRLMAQWAIDHPDIHTGHFFIMEPLKEARVGSAAGSLRLLMGAVGFVLLVVCANVANLLLVRGQTRQKETAIRRALGAGRWRILQGGLTQSLILASLGAAIGLALAVVGVDALLALAGSNLPRSEEVAVDGTVVAFTAALALITSLMFGLIPAAQAARSDNLQALGEGGRSGTATGPTLRARNGLVMAEVALSIVLVIGAGLMIRSFARLLSDDTGFDPSGALIASLSLPGAQYDTAEQVATFYRQLLDCVQGLPGVDAATASSSLPIFSGPRMNDFVLEGLPPPGEGEPAWNAAVSLVRPTYFETMKTPVVRGRGIERSDTWADEPVVVVSESLVRRFIPPDRDPIGLRMRFSGAADEAPWWTIVGVVADVQYNGLGQDASPAYYLSHEQIPVTLSGAGWGGFMTLLVRTQGDPQALVPGLRDAVAELDPALPLIAVQTYAKAVSESVAQPRLVMTLMGFFAAVALLLGAVGIYGVTSFAVTQRRHEIGIRMALGARKEEVAALVVRRGMWPVLAGVVVGLIGAVAASRLLESLLFEVSRTDVPTYAGVVVILTGVGLLSCWLPARRAMSVDPMTTLKAE